MSSHFIFWYFKQIGSCCESSDNQARTLPAKLSMFKKLNLIQFQFTMSNFLLLVVIMMAFSSPNLYAQTQMNQRHSNPSMKENKNALQLKQAIREMHLQRLKEKQAERKIENQLERERKFEEIKRERVESTPLEKKERFMQRMNALSPEERQALRKQIKEARMQIYEKTDK